LTVANWEASSSRGVISPQFGQDKTGIVTPHGALSAGP
jgi:hypothetical protein